MAIQPMAPIPPLSPNPYSPQSIAHTWAARSWPKRKLLCLVWGSSSGFSPFLVPYLDIWHVRQLTQGMRSKKGGESGAHLCSTLRISLLPQGWRSTGLAEPGTLGPQKGPGFQTQWCAGETPAGSLSSAHVLDLGLSTACLVRSPVVLQTIKINIKICCHLMLNPS
jgi:hypothetical protein